MQRDLTQLAVALEQVKARAFPAAPRDADLADWILDLAELDGYLVGCAMSSISANDIRPVPSAAAVGHAARLAEMQVSGDDEAIYSECVSYIAALQRLEEELAARRG